MGNQALLSGTCVPNLGAVSQHRNDKCVVNVLPIHEVKTPNGVPEDTYPMYGGVCVVDHDANMLHPFEVIGEEDPKVPERGDCRDMVLGVADGVVGALNRVTCEIGLPRGVENHELSLCWVGREAIVVKPGEGKFKAVDGRAGSG